MLEVCVHENAVISRSILKLRTHCGLFSEIPGKEFAVSSIYIFYCICSCPVKCRQRPFFIIIRKKNMSQ